MIRVSRQAYCSSSIVSQLAGLIIIIKPIILVSIRVKPQHSLYLRHVVVACTRANDLTPRPPPTHQLKVICSRRGEQGLVKITAHVLLDIEADATIRLAKVCNSVMVVTDAI